MTNENTPHFSYNPDPQTPPEQPVTPGPAQPCPGWMRVVAQVMSKVFSPLLVPTYGMGIILLTTIMRFLPGRACWTLMLVTFATTCIIPALAIFALWRLKYITDPGLNRRAERPVPYIITCICYVALAFYLYRANAPQWVWAFPAGGAAAVAVCMTINMRWKISAHLAAMGGLLAVMFRTTAMGVTVVNMGVWLTVAVLLTGLLATSRVALNRHTVGQTIAGTAVGFLAVFLLSL